MSNLDKIFQIARLEKKGNESFEDEINPVLKAFDKISRVDTNGIKKALHPIDFTSELREDEPIIKNNKEEALKLTKHSGKDYFLGPNLK